MTPRPVSLILCATALVAACQSTTTAREAAQPAPQGRSAETETPPEYLPCRDLEQALSMSDARMRRLNSRNMSSEATYLRDRNKRLIARAYECRRPS
ncbi:hypothetical protein [Rhodovulum sulfidophilum]|uniref:Lipoprotein n=1 Tax=Rhodovulum sulfidophilum TaxID=35806 RepID=A0ABS1RRA9_RHOSU|nr:hypothetical protein [Rhodovulum sulfidophilum]MBL3608599.1 hypothetical protein [Rhodovulum sulfidophilum]MCE8456647.1 hypothetical protein [Rhodovulum sulfidophilum]